MAFPRKERMSSKYEGGFVKLSIFLFILAVIFSIPYALELFRNEPDANPGPDVQKIVKSRPEYSKAVTAPPPPQKIKKEERTVTVRRGDSLLKILVREGISYGEANAAVSAIKDVFNPRHLRPGQEVSLFFIMENELCPDCRFQGLGISPSIDYDVYADRTAHDTFTAKKVPRLFDTRVIRKAGTIRSSLYVSAVETGLPVSLLPGLIELFSYDVDFQRDIHPLDHYEVIYESKIDEDGKIVQSGPILFASLSLGENTLYVYRHKNGSEKADYYNEKGETVRKTLLLTPINGARITSRYGKRRHPILGYSRMHRGLDFAAPSGTPIRASGSGVIEFAGRKNGYGNFIKIRHVNGYSSGYGHLRAFRKGIRKNRRVEQGDIIGYVGSTGLATGPHLHYEVHYRGNQINPSKIKFPPRRTLADEELRSFLAAKAALDEKVALLRINDTYVTKDSTKTNHSPDRG